jgi:hypothetical protein
MGKYTTMKTKNKPIDLKKIPYYLLLSLLTTGASLILGLLSFSGMYALLPVLPFAIATFVLSVAYEGEIYSQNIKGALAKLFKPHYLENHLAKEYLLTHFSSNTINKNCPQFFKDYKAHLILLSQFEGKEPHPENAKREKQLRKTVQDMESWFTKQLFTPKNKDTTTSRYTEELQTWLAEHERAEWQQRIPQRHAYFNMVKGFSAVAALFMSLGSTYLIVEAFSVIPFLAAIPLALWPAIILPMAVVSGTAYGLLTYNAVTDLINNNTVLKWYHKLKNDLEDGLTPRTFFMTATAAFLVTLAAALTVCTAGTWWTIATNARPLFDWMKKMPPFVMGVINPIITGASAIFFNIENTAESMDMVDQALRSEINIFDTLSKAFKESWAKIRQTENGWQIANPFRLLLKLTFTPLRVLLFMGHLVSIALTSDRMPGVPQIVSALIAIICEGFEDAHYFVSHQHKDNDFACILKDRLTSASGHNHSEDIPTWLLHIIASPVYALAALWDSSASQLNPKKTRTNREKVPLSFAQAWDKQYGVKPQGTAPAGYIPADEWQNERVEFLIEEQIERLTQVNVNSTLAQEKITHLKTLKTTVRDQGLESLENNLDQEKTNPVYNKHRLFAIDKQTETQQFIEELPYRMGLK